MKRLKYRLVSVCLILAMLMPMLPVETFAASDKWSYSTSDKPKTGRGTQSNPYVITNANELLLVLDRLEKGYYAVLGNDIDLSSKIWPGTLVAGFAASLDGRGHTIWGMRSDCGALFDSLYEGGTVSNLNIEVRSATLKSGPLVNFCWGNVIDCTAFGTVAAEIIEMESGNGNNYIGGLVGFQGITVGGTAGTISGCKNYTDYYLWTSGEYNSYFTFGGIVADAAANIENCENYGEVQVSVIPDQYGSTDLQLVLAGIAGRTTDSMGNVTGCINHGNITAIDTTVRSYSLKNTVGGIVGNAKGGTFSECMNEGVLEGGGCCTGGVVGNTYSSWVNDITIKNCINDSDISSLACAGGIVGEFVKESTGVLTIENCTNFGDVTGGDYAGGIAGYNDGRIVESINEGNIYGKGIQSTIGGIAGYNHMEDLDSSAEPTQECSGVIHLSNNEGTLDGEGYSGGIAGINEGYLYLCENTGSVAGYSAGGVAAYNQPSPSSWSDRGVIDGCTANCTVEAKGGEAAGISVNGNNYAEATVAIRDSYFRGNITGSGDAVYGVAGWGENTSVNGCYAIFYASGYNSIYGLGPVSGADSSPGALCSGVYSNRGGSSEYAEIRSAGRIASSVSDLNTLGGTVTSRGTWRNGDYYPEPSGLPVPMILPTVGSVDENGHTVYHATDGQRILRIFPQGWPDSAGELAVTATVKHKDGTTSVYEGEWRFAYAEIRMRIDDTDMVVISAPGYQTDTISAVLLGFLTEIKLVKSDNSGKPSLQGFYLDRSSGSYRKTYNLLTEGYNIEYKSVYKYSFYVDVNWNGGERGSIYLMQGDEVRLELQEGWNRDHRLGQLFEWEEGRIAICMDNGTVRVKTPIGISLHPETEKYQTVETGDRVTSDEPVPEDAEAVAGQTFSIDMGVLTDSGIPISFEIDPDDSMKVTFGINFAKMNDKLDDEGNQASKGESVFTTIKNALNKWNNGGEAVGTEEYNALETKVTKDNELVMKHKTHYAISSSVKVLGYGEGRFYEARPYLSEAGAILNVSGQISGMQPVYLFVPFHVEYGIGASLTFIAAFEQDPSSGRLIPKGYLEGSEKGLNLSGSLEFFGGPAIGDPSIVSAKLRATGTVTSEMNIPFDSDEMKLYSSVAADIIGSIAGFEGKWRLWQGDKFVIYENGEWFPEYGLAALSMDEDMAAGGMIEPERSYLDNGSAFTANVSPFMRLGSNDADNKTILTNVYPFADVEQASFSDGSRLLVWNGDLESRTDADRSVLFYSYYDASTGMWTEPSQVEEDDSTADYYHTLRCFDDAAYLVWNEADASLEGNAGEEVTEEDIINRLNAFGLSYARFDRSAASFADISQITEKNGKADLLADMTIVGGLPTVVWVQTSNGLNLDDGVLHSASLIDGSWSSSALAELSGIDGLAATEEEGQLAVYYSRSESDDPADRDLYRWCDGIETIVSDEEDITENKPVFSNGRLAWYEGGAIHTTEGISAPITGGGDCFQYLYNDSNGRQAIVYATADGTGSELKAVFSNDGFWGEPITLAETETGLFYSFSGVLLDDGTLSVSANLWDESSDRVADIVMVDIDPYPELKLEQADYDALTLVPGSELEVVLSVKNIGSRDTNAVRTDFYSEGALIDSCVTKVRIPSGASETFIARCSLPEEISTRTISVHTYAIGVQPEVMTADESSDIVLNTTDLSLEEMYAKQLAGQTLVTLQIVNRGLTELDDVALTLRKGAYDGPVIADQVVVAPLAGDSQTVVFVADQEIAAGTVLYVTAEVQKGGENIISNNSILAVLQEAESVGFTYDAELSGNKVNITASNMTDEVKKVRFIVASYENGRMIGCVICDAELEGYTEAWEDTVGVIEGDNIRVYVLDDDMEPISEAIELK